MIQLNVIIRIVFLLYFYFSYAKSENLISSRIYFPIINITETLLGNGVDIFHRIYDTNAVNYNIKRVSKLSDRRDIRNLEVLHFVSRVKEHEGYSAATYNVTSEDGYNLKLHRLYSTRTRTTEAKPVVYIQHGLFMSSDCFVLLGPNRDLVYILADAGFDVWIGNARGNTYSRSHENIAADQPEFWDFSFEEIGKIDIAAFIKKIIEETQVEKIDFIGYQLGATEGLIYIINNLDYAKNVIRLFVAVSPLAYWNDTNITSENDNSVPYIRKKIMQTAYTELYPQSRFSGIGLPYLCKEYDSALCLEVIKSFFGSDIAFNYTGYVDILKHFPAGTSKKTILHLLQNIESGRFAKFDNDYAANLENNFQSYFQPSEYDLTKISIPVVIFNKNSPERFVKLKDYERLQAELPNVVTNSIDEDVDNLWPVEQAKEFQKYLVDLLINFKA